MFDIIAYKQLNDIVCKLISRGVRAELDVEAKRLSTYRGGGKVKAVCYPKSVDELALVYTLADGLPKIILGNGSNVLIPDKGFAGIAIRTTALTHRPVVNGNRLSVSAGMNLGSLINTALGLGLSGIEELSGIPATVGGATYMNAGAFKREMHELVSSVTLLDTSSGKTIRLINKELSPSYRSSGLPQGAVVTEVELTLSYSDSDLTARRNVILDKRRLLHPSEPSLGSVFKRARSGIGAGYYVDKCGLKGVCVGGAKISEKHANFIVNADNGSASDYIALLKIAKAVVKRKFDVDLEPEICVLDTE